MPHTLEELGLWLIIPVLGILCFIFAKLVSGATMGEDIAEIEEEVRKDEEREALVRRVFGSPLEVSDVVKAMDLTFNAVAPELPDGITPIDLLGLMVATDFVNSEGVANRIRYEATDQEVIDEAVEVWSRSRHVDEDGRVRP